MSIIFTKIEAAPIGENTYVIKDESTGKCAVIDPGCMTASINRFIYDGSGLEYILLTHAHWDHIAALNEYVSKYPDARVVASFDEREMLIDSSINHSARYTESAISREADIYVSDICMFYLLLKVALHIFGRFLFFLIDDMDQILFLFLYLHHNQDLTNPYI